MCRSVALVVLSVLLAPAAGLAQPGCPWPERAGERSYRNTAHGFGFDHPAIFTLDPASVPEAGDSARFWTPGREATAVVNVSPNRRGLDLRALMAEAEGDVVENSRGEITYRRIRDDWFVLSGYIVGRIFYRRTMLLADGRAATLWMEFPRELRRCLDGPVTTMSLSFRALR